MRAIVLSDELDPGAELAALTARARKAGGVVSFIGLAREEEGEVTELFLEQHPVLTERSLLEIAAMAEARFAVDAITVAHRAGRVSPGEPIVFAGAAARHRRDAFLAADYLMDMLKTQAVFWKKESGPAGARWIEPRDVDYADAARWQAPELQEGRQ